MEARRQLTARDGASLVYWIRRPENQTRESPALLLLHGAASNHTRWSEFVDATTLSRSHVVIRPDLRGNGASMVRGRLDLETWSHDLLEILQAEDCSQAMLVGHSLGAQIALDFAYRHSDSARSLVLIGPVFRRSLTGARKRLSRLMPLIVPATWLIRGLNAIGVRRRDIRTERDLRELDERTREALRGGESYAEIARRYSALGPILRHMPVANYLQQLRATVADVPPLERLDLPVLVLLSSGITFANLERTRAEIARLPHSDTVTVDANHWPLTERPDEVRDAIERWVERSPPPVC